MRGINLMAESHRSGQSKMKSLLLRFGLCLVSLLGLDQGALALTCSYSPAGPSNVTIALPASLTVARDTAVGTTLWSTSTANTQSLSTTCNGNWYPDIGYAPGVSLGSTTQTDVYATNVPGIGITVTGYGHAMPAPGTAYNALGGSNSYPPTGVGSYLSFKLSIIVTGKIDGGTLTLPSPLAGGYASASPTNLANAFAYGQLLITGSTSIAQKSCTTPDVNVTLGNHRASEFSGVGSTTSATNFSIALNGCPSGMNTIKYQIDPVTAIVPGTGNSVVTLNSGSTANRIGVQLLDGSGNPFALSAPVTFSGYNTSTGGNYTIPLRARYYQTGTPVGPGTANAAMTFTMTYQ